MANFDASITVRDGDATESQVLLHGVFADIATAKTNLQSVAELMDDIILGKVVGASITETLDASGWSVKGAPDADSDVEIKGRFIFGTTNAKVKPRLSIPTFDKATHTVTGGSIPFDLGGTDPVDLFLIAMVDQNWTDYRFLDFNDVLKAYEEFE